MSTTPGPSPFEYAAREITYTTVAVEAVTEAARTEEDFARWLAGVLARATGA